jgi:ABC-2 family transporter protein
MRLVEILSTGFAASPAGVQVWSNLALGVASFLAAWAAFGRFCDRAPEDVETGSRGQRRFLGLRFPRPRRPWKNALAWKEFHFLCGGTPGFIARCVLYGAALGGAIYVWATQGGGSGGTGGVMVFVGMGLMSLASFAFAIDLAAMSSRIFRQELRDQTLANLATLPITMRQLAYRKTLGLILAAAPGAVCVFAITGIFYFSIPEPGGTGSVQILLSAVTSAIHSVFLAHVVVYLSLYLKRGALPLGLIASQVLSTLFSIILMAIIFAGGFTGGLSGGIAGNIMIIQPLMSVVMYIGLTIFFHFKSLRRLEVLVGEN